jgi:hypothetical protein
MNFFDDVQKFVNQNSEHLVYLACRWEDEREYEDIEDYETEIQKILPAGWLLIRMHDEPFAFDLWDGTAPWLVRATLEVGEESVSSSFEEVAPA